MQEELFLFDSPFNLSGEVGGGGDSLCEFFIFVCPRFKHMFKPMLKHRAIKLTL